MSVLGRTSTGHACNPRQSVGGGKFIQKRVRTRFPLLKTTALRGKLTFGDPFEDSGVDRAVSSVISLSAISAGTRQIVLFDLSPFRLIFDQPGPCNPTPTFQYGGTSLIRKRLHPRTTMGLWAETYCRVLKGGLFLMADRTSQGHIREFHRKGG